MAGVGDCDERGIIAAAWFAVGVPFVEADSQEDGKGCKHGGEAVGYFVAVGEEPVEVLFGTGAVALFGREFDCAEGPADEGCCVANSVRC